MVHWVTRDADRVAVALDTPGGCRIESWKPASGSKVRRGPTHLIVRVPLPYACKGRKIREGTWRLSVKNRADEREEVEVIVFGRSDSDLWARMSMSRYGPVVTARLLRDGRLVPNAKVIGRIVIPLPSTGGHVRTVVLHGWCQGRKSRPWSQSAPGRSCLPAQYWYPRLSSRFVMP